MATIPVLDSKRLSVDTPERERHDSHDNTPKSDILDTSDLTNSSTFSSYARPKRFSFNDTPISKRARQPQDNRIPLGERSLASLTSGIADNGYISR